MKRQLGVIAAAAVLAGLLVGGTARAAAIDVLVGDKDGFGFAVPCPDTGSCPGLNVPPIDNRDAAEKAATNGAQITDVYSGIFPGFGPNTSTTADVMFPFAGTLTSALLSFAGGDFQSDVFGPILGSINGTSESFFFPDGRFVTAIHSFTLSAAELAAANAAHEVLLHLDHATSTDFIAFDWFEVTGQTAAVPEPASLILLGSALVGFGLCRRRRPKA